MSKDKWNKIYADTLLYKIKITQAILEEFEIEAVIINKQDYAYGFGDIELWVKQDHTVQALKIVNEINFDQ